VVTVTLIEKALAALSSAKFQQLADAYLHRFKSWPLQSWGLMLGADKDKTGVPDAYCYLPDEDKYVLAAYTTTGKAKLSTKLREDLADCLAEAERLLSPSRVDRIVLACNSVVAPAIHAALVVQASPYVLEVFGLQDFVRMIIEYPPLAYEYINLDLGRGQLLQATDFINAYGRQLGATPLNNILFGRDDEQRQMSEALASQNLVLVTGPAGVGKTQLVVTVAQSYCAADPAKRQLYFVHDKNSADFAHELQLLLAPGRELVVVADDANRVSPHLRALLGEQATRPSGQLKIVATIRDYARDQVRHLTAKIQSVEIHLNPLSDEHITALLKSDAYKISTSECVRRILEISKGHPRLAVMSALTALRSQRIDDLYDVADLYEQYFGPILQHLAEQPNARRQQKTAAILHLFGSIRQNDTDRLAEIERAFKVSSTELWEALCELNDLELVEMFENRIARTGDQILSNYLFYQAFFGDKPLLPFADVLTHFFPAWSTRIRDAVIPVINDFNHVKLEPRFRPALTAWLAQPSISSDARWQFYQTFWPYLRHEIVADAQAYLDSLPWPEQPLTAYVVSTDRNANSSLKKSKVLAALQSLCEVPVDEQSLALHATIELAAKRPDQFQLVLELLRKLAQFNGDDYRKYGLHIPELVLSTLRGLADDTHLGAFSQWLLQHIVPHALATAVQGVRSGASRNSISICTYVVPFTVHPQAWRQALWQTFQQLVEDDSNRLVPMFEEWFRQREYMWAMDADAGKNNYDWQRWDASFIVPLLHQLDPSNFIHCKLALRYYYKLTHRLSSQEAQSLLPKFSGGLYSLFELMVFNPDHRFPKERTIMRGYGEQAEQFRRERLKKLFYKSLAPYKKLINNIHALIPGLSDHERQQACDSYATILAEVIERDYQLGRTVLRYLITTGNPHKLTPWRAIEVLAASSSEDGYQLITQSEYKVHDTWKWIFLSKLPADNISMHWLDELYKLVAAAPDVNFRFEFLKAYEPLAQNLYPQLAKLVLDWPADAKLGLKVDYTFVEVLGHHFAQNEQELLQRIYLLQCKAHTHFDYNGEQLAILLTEDPEFALRYHKETTKDRGYSSRYETRRLSILWKNKHFRLYLLHILQDLSTDLNYFSFNDDSLANTFLPVTDDEEEKAEQDAFLTAALAHFLTNPNAIRLIFALIRERKPGQLAQFLNELLTIAPNDFELYDQLDFVSTSRVFSGSYADVLEQDVSRWNEMLTVITSQPKQTSTLRKLQMRLLSLISGAKRSITQEREREFASPY
jgi:hypothetical protein